LLQDGRVGLGGFPGREETIAGSACLSAIALQDTGASGAEMRQRPDRFFFRNAAMSEDFLGLT